LEFPKNGQRQRMAPIFRTTHPQRLGKEGEEKMTVKLLKYEKKSVLYPNEWTRKGDKAHAKKVLRKLYRRGER